MNATSKLETQAEYEITDDVKAKFFVSTPHHYKLSLATDLTNRFKDSGVKLNDVELKGDLECDEHTKTYPTKFSLKGKYSD